LDAGTRKTAQAFQSKRIISNDKMKKAMPAEVSSRQVAECLYHEALDLVASGDPDAAVKFREALTLDPDLLDAMHGLIRALQDSGDYDEAIAVAHELIIRDADDPLAHTSLSILYQHKGMISEAEAEALKAKLLGWKLELSESRSAK
jgi:Flp pilus assembly protein TadD